MTGYKIYLTRSYEVAGLIGRAHEIGKSGVIRIEFGSADNNESVPAIYHGEGYFACVVVTETDRPLYEIVFA